MRFLFWAIIGDKNRETYDSWTSRHKPVVKYEDIDIMDSSSAKVESTFDYKFFGLSCTLASFLIIGLGLDQWFQGYF